MFRWLQIAVFLAIFLQVSFAKVNITVAICSDKNNDFLLSGGGERGALFVRLSPNGYFKLRNSLTAGTVYNWIRSKKNVLMFRCAGLSNLAHNNFYEVLAANFLITRHFFYKIKVCLIEFCDQWRLNLLIERI